MNPNIWQSIEFYCISKSFTYTQYLELLKQHSFKHKPLLEKSYIKAEEIFNHEINDDFNSRA